MPPPDGLHAFYEDLSQEILCRAELDEEGGFRENEFTGICIDLLTEAGELEDGQVCHYESRELKVSGYSLSEEDESRLTLLTSIYRNEPEPFAVSLTDVRAMLERARKFCLRALHGLYLKLEEAYESYDLARSIYQRRTQLREVRRLLLTNGTVRSTSRLRPWTDDGVAFVPAVMDLERMHRLTTSGEAHEKIEFTLEELDSQPLQAVCIRVPPRETPDTSEAPACGGYATYLTVMPGRLLHQLYGRFGQRLLERNVRAFLQARGQVNRGIRDTIRTAPEMFLAYNNGISATAEHVELRRSGGGACEITGIRDLQIVNGGQTTASVYHACLRDASPLRSLYVPVKITVPDEPAMLDGMVPLISRYANTQNRIQLSDFSVNDPFHRALERLSRTVWAPARSGGERQSKWFYERARGQYREQRASAPSRAYFDSVYPASSRGGAISQYFDRLQMARYENDWDQLPHIASRGGQASFREFTLRQSRAGQPLPDQGYFQDLIAKAILHRSITVIVRQLGLRGYWANVADYTMAWISHATDRRLDLGLIWKRQALSEAVTGMIREAAAAVHDFIIASAAGSNVTQWCKKEECWLRLRGELPVTPGDAVMSELMTSLSDGEHSHAD